MHTCVAGVGMCANSVVPIGSLEQDLKKAGTTNETLINTLVWRMDNASKKALLNC